MDGRIYGRTDIQTDIRTDRPSYRDARMHLKTRENHLSSNRRYRLSGWVLASLLLSALPPRTTIPWMLKIQRTEQRNKYRGGTSDATTSSSLIVPLFMSFADILDAPLHLYERSCRSVRRYVRRSVCPVLFLNDDMTVFEGRKSLYDIIINDTMSDEVVASDVPPRYLFHLGLSSPPQ